MVVEHSDKANLRLCEILRNAKVKLKPCPFCGENVNSFPLVMTIQPVHSDEYLLAKLNKGHFLSGENGYLIKCPRCGAQGSSDTNVILAVNKWNNRRKKRTTSDNAFPLDDTYRGYKLSRDDLKRIGITEQPICCGKCRLNGKKGQ